MMVRMIAPAASGLSPKSGGVGYWRSKYVRIASDSDRQNAPSRITGTLPRGFIASSSGDRCSPRENDKKAATGTAPA